MPTLQVRLFGQLSMMNAEVVWQSNEANKVQELLCYLLIHREARHRREQLAAIFWGESSTAQAKRYLRQALWQLHSAFEMRLGLGDNRLVLADVNCIRVNPQVDLWTDIGEFESAYSFLRSGSELDPTSAGKVREAIDLYQGDLLEGWYQDWCLYEREHLQNKYLTMLDRLACYLESRREYETALRYAERILERDPARERAHQQIMRLYYRAGDRTAALQQFHRCAQVLRKELDIEPTTPTLALYEQIRSDQLENFLPQPIPRTSDSNAGLLVVLDHLKSIQECLGGWQRQLQKDIKSVEHQLKKSKA